MTFLTVHINISAFRHIFNSSAYLYYIYFKFKDEDIYLTESNLPNELNVSINDE